jgi:hypothetical protein
VWKEIARAWSVSTLYVHGQVIVHPDEKTVPVPWVGFVQVVAEYGDVEVCRKGL